MKKGFRTIFIGIVVAIIVLVLAYKIVLYQQKRGLEKRGNKWLPKIEAFEQQHHYLPDSLEQAGITRQDNDPHYFKKDSSVFYLYYFVGLDYRGFVYNSKTGQWQWIDTFNISWH